MINLSNQEKQTEIISLRSLLRGVPAETKNEQEWQCLENAILADMDEIEKKGRPNNRLVSSFIPLPFSFRKAIPYCVAASLISILGVGTFYSQKLNSPQPLVVSRILGSTGSVSFTQPELTGSKQIHQSLLFNGQVLQTAQGATLIVRIDEGSSFILSEKTKLTVNKANSREIAFYLHTGSILASVSKRDKSQTFTISTNDAMCTIVGTVFSISVSDETGSIPLTSLTVLEGKVSIAEQKNRTKTEMVSTGETAQLRNHQLKEPEQASEKQISSHYVSLLQQAQQMGIDKKKSSLVDIKSIPSGAKIYIADTYVGTTPMSCNYPAGTFSIKLALPGYSTWEQSVELQPLNTSFIGVELSTVEKIENQKYTTSVSEKKRKALLKKTLHPAVTISNKNTEDSQPQTKDFGFILNPAFVEALVQMTVGEYQKALTILDSLKNLPEISITEKIRIMSKISTCYKEMGNFENTLKNLTKRYTEAISPIEKSNLLWEVVTVRANCLQDYEGAEKDILTYIQQYPDGAWVESAYAKLGEIQYITGKYAKAVGTYQYHINLFKSSNEVEKSIYTIANILRMDIKEYSQAVKWYSKLLKEYPNSGFYGNALVERADCYEKLNNYENAQKDYKKYLSRFPDGYLKTLCSSRLTTIEE